LKKKLAFIVQRYGLEVNGGAEYHCRVIVEKLKDIYEIEVLTSCAKDYTTWNDEYESGTSVINDVTVHRFPSANPRDRKNFRLISRKLKKRKTYQKLLRSLGLLDFYEKIIPSKITDDDYRKWVQYQGPYLPQLIDYLKVEHQNYDALIFFTYLYYPTIEGIKIAPEKSILIPTAHDEAPIYFPFFKQFFNTPKAILYNTLSEQRFVNRLFGNNNIYATIAGIGIDAHNPEHPVDLKSILKTSGEYLLYVGRVDAFKGCQMLCNYLLKYNSNADRPVKLVLVGQVIMPVPVNEHIITLGFVSDDVKITLMQNARALIIPSFYESLSLVTLESMAYGVPVIANEKCEVLKDHIDNSKAGFLFGDYESFKTDLDIAFNPYEDLSEMSKNAKAYVAQNYTWDATIEKYRKAINYVSPG